MSDLRDTRLEKAKKLQSIGYGPYGLKFRPTDTAVVLQEKYKELPNGEEYQKEVSIAGRVTSRRVMGKLAFFTLLDETGTIQLFLEKATLNQNENTQNQKNNFDLIHIHSVGTYGIFAIIPILFNVPFIVTPWGSDIIFGSRKFINTLILVLKYLAIAILLTQKEKILSVVIHGESVKVAIAIILLLLWEM